MHLVSFSPAFEKEVLTLDYSLDELKSDLTLHFDQIGSDEMPVHYLGKTDAFDYPQVAVDAFLSKIHVYDPSCSSFNSKEQHKWNQAEKLHHRTSNTYFVYTIEYFNEYHLHFLGVLNPGHLKCNVNKSGLKWFGPLAEAANKFNGM